MAIGDATFYTHENTGHETIPAVPNATFSMYGNSGATLTASPEATTALYTNTGIAPPMSLRVKRSLQGWGLVMVDGPLEADVSIDSANATAYNYEGDVTA